MDVRHISNVFVAKNCTRTNGADTILGAAVTGVQVQSSLEDDGSAAETYFGAGELVITNDAGAPQTSAITKAVESIVIHLRDVDGLSSYRSKEIKGSSIKGYNIRPYEAPVEQVGLISTIPVSNSFTYIVRVRREGSKRFASSAAYAKTISFTSDASATGAEIATGLVNEINRNFGNDTMIPLVATAVGVGSVDVLITAKPLTWELGKYNYEKLRFVVELVGFDATVQYNKYASLLHNAITYPKMAFGNGTYQQVAEMDWFAKQYTGVLPLVNSRFPVTPIKINAISSNTYDIVTINWNQEGGDFSKSIVQHGDVVIALPVESNATSQVAAIIATLDAYIATSYGVGTALAGSLS